MTIGTRLRTPTIKRQRQKGSCLATAGPAADQANVDSAHWCRVYGVGSGAVDPEGIGDGASDAEPSVLGGFLRAAPPVVL